MKLWLTLEAGSDPSREYQLDHGNLVLGRDPECGVRFDEAGAQVSRRHAVIEARADGFWIADQKSTNGTHVNGERVTSSRLADGDLIELGAGGPRLHVRIALPAPAPPATRPMPKASLADASLYNPARDKGHRHSLVGVGVVLLMLLAGIGFGLLLLMMTAFELGPGASIAGIVVAFLPAPFYLAIWLWLDRYDPEPAWILAGCLVWGAGAATFVAAMINDAFGAVVHSVTNSAPLASLLSASISAPFVEEATKGLAVLLIFLFLRREFDGVIDGIVYAGVVALGFATVENVLYYGRMAAKGGAGDVLVLFVLRGVLGPFGHALYTSMTGIGLGIARQTHSTALRLLAPPLGYAVAVFLHSLWNTIPSLVPELFLVFYLLVWVPLFLGFFAVVVWMGFREGRLIRRMLEPEVAMGLVTSEQVEIAGSWLRRVRWLGSALFDPKRLGARRRFLYAASRLGLCYWHVERANAAGGLTQSFGQLATFRQELERLRSAV